MKRTCEVCNYMIDISEVYVGRRLKNWPKVMCKTCRNKYYPSFSAGLYRSQIKTNRNALQILLDAAYPKHLALKIINEGL